jgi:hypothetical protein
MGKTLPGERAHWVHFEAWRKITFLCLDYRATPDAVHCCSIRWKSSEEMLWHTQRERFSTAPTSCSLCYSASCGAFAPGLSLHVPNNFHFVWSLKKQFGTFWCHGEERVKVSVLEINTGSWFYLFFKIEKIVYCGARHLTFSGIGVRNWKVGLLYLVLFDICVEVVCWCNALGYHL